MRLGAGRIAAAAAAAFALAIQPAACGDDGDNDPTSPDRLTKAEGELVLAYDRRIEAHCVRVARSLVDPRAGPSPGQRRRAFAAADSLLALAADNPRAPVGPGQDLRLFVSDVAENLEGSNCDPRMIARLEQGLARLPPP